MSREITVSRARRLHRAIRARWDLGQPEGYGIAIETWSGAELSGSTHRTPVGLYCFDTRKMGDRTRILFTKHPSEKSQ